MTATARRVLSDCKIAFGMLEEEQDNQKWRIIWTGGITLLRTVGDVLHKVDGCDIHGKKNALWQVQNDLFNSWGDLPENAIFRNFIKRERDSILHEYSTAVYPENEIQLYIENTGSETSEVFELESDLYRPILEGYGQGEDARDVFAEAIEWWELQLDIIDGKVNNSSNK